MCNASRHTWATRRGFTAVELVVAIAIVVVLLLVILPKLMESSEPRKQLRCVANLQQWHTIFAMYASESEGGLYPPIQTEPQILLAPRLASIYPEYVTDLSIIACPSNRGAVAGLKYKDGPNKGQWRVPDDPALLCTSYRYFAWAFDRIDDVPEQTGVLSAVAPKLTAGTVPVLPMGVFRGEYPVQFVQVIEQLVAKREAETYKEQDFDGDIKLAPPNGNYGGAIVHRLAEGVDRLLITDIPNPAALAPNRIPVMMDAFVARVGMASFNHLPGASNILYLDGHVEFQRYPGEGVVNPAMGLAFYLPQLDPSPYRKLMNPGASGAQGP